ncbi:hypothetical protein SAMN06295955_11126 [Sphingopyxis indica]|uniref:Uncharacterized protein n=1 Tax=Sphingopyxis indica TaxID=436663 RepID=A0A239JQT0_9SPHN|nr:hypothetical protein SAMN06295955_11126 [Sphingopyxis indica]
MVLVQRVTQLRHVNIHPAIGIAGNLVEVVADAVEGGERLHKCLMLDGAAATRAWACVA